MVELEELRNRVEGMQQSLDKANATIATKDVEVANLTKENVTLVESKTALNSALQQQEAKLREERSRFEAMHRMFEEKLNHVQDALTSTIQDALMEKTKAFLDQAQVHEGNIADIRKEHAPRAGIEQLLKRSKQMLDQEKAR